MKSIRPFGSRIPSGKGGGEKEGERRGKRRGTFIQLSQASQSTISIISPSLFGFHLCTLFHTLGQDDFKTFPLSLPAPPPYTRPAAHCSSNPTHIYMDVSTFFLHFPVLPKDILSTLPLLIELHMLSIT